MYLIYIYIYIYIYIFNVYAIEKPFPAMDVIHYVLENACTRYNMDFTFGYNYLNSFDNSKMIYCPLFLF
jgi:hypothetical protein